MRESCKLCICMGTFLHAGTFFAITLCLLTVKLQHLFSKFLKEVLQLRLYRDYLVPWTIWSRAIISLLFGSRNRLTRAYLVRPPAGTIWSRGLFGFAFIAPRIGTLQLLQLYETDANDVTMAMIIFTPLPDVSMSRNRVRPASSSFLFGFM